MKNNTPLFETCNLITVKAVIKVHPDRVMLNFEIVILIARIL